MMKYLQGSSQVNPAHLNLSDCIDNLALYKIQTSMRLKIYQLLVFAILISPLRGQSQQTAFSMLINGSTEIRAVCENMDGNYVATGYTFSGNQANATIMEISPTGDILQQNVFGSTATELPYAVVQASAGYYLVTGSMYDNFNDYDWFVAKLDSALQIVWFKRMGAVSGNDYSNSCFEVSPDHFVVTGTVGLLGSAKPSVVLIDSSGSVLQQGYLNTNQFASPNYRGRYLGNGEVAFANLATAIAVLDTSGNLVKQSSFNVATYTRDIRLAPNGSYAICGVAGFGGPQGSSIAFAITDSTLSNTLLLKKFNQNGLDLSVVSMEAETGGNYVLAVNATGLSSGNTAPVLIKIDSLGNLISAKSYLPLGFQNVMIQSMIKSSDGSYLIVGGSGTTGFIAKVDSANSCFFSPLSLATNTLVNLPATPHSTVSGTINIINPQVNSIATGTQSPNYLCNPSSIEEADETMNNVIIYPTLTDDWLHVTLQNTDARAFQMEVFQNTGKLVMTKIIYPPTDVDISELAHGIYFCRFKDFTHELSSSARFLKVK
jgi:hypothetical protein